MRESMKAVMAILVVIVLAGVFWFALLAPKREKADELSERAGAISAEVASAQSQLAAAEKARKNFSSLYSELILLGKAVPSESGTASLVVQLQGIANYAKTSFVTISFGGEGASETEATPAAGTSTSQLPLGASVGPAGLPAMPYTLQLTGDYFEIAKFIKRLDASVRTGDTAVEADGRLVVIDGFTIEPVREEGGGSGPLKASLQVTTYVAPPGEGLTAGATAVGPEAVATGSETLETGVTP